MLRLQNRIYQAGKWISGTVEAVDRTRLPCGSVGAVTKLVFYPLNSSRAPDRNTASPRGLFSEKQRLIHDAGRLFGFYPALRDDLLISNHPQPLPYQVLSGDAFQVALIVKDDPYTLPPALNDIAGAIHRSLASYYQQAGITYQPAQLVRACQFIGGGDPTLTVSPASYTDAATTNLIADLDLAAAFQQLPGIGQLPAANLRAWDQLAASSPGSLPGFERSFLANPLGVAGLGLTADHKIILTHRSATVSTYAGMLGPTSSGYVTWQDLTRAPVETLGALLLRALLRETNEELHLDPTDEVSDFQSLGFLREFYRAGLPQGFFSYRIHLTAEQLANRLMVSTSDSEIQGILAVPAEPEALGEVLMAGDQGQTVGRLVMALEAQGLLCALVGRMDGSRW